MMKNWSGILCLVLVCTLAAGCGASGAPSSSAVSSSGEAPFSQAAAAPQGELLDTVNREHEAVTKPQVRYEDYIREASDDTFDIREYMVDMSSDYGKAFVGDTPLTLEQAQEDLDVLFRTLQTTYGAYYYFGGDEVFGKAKEAVLQGCREAESLTCNVLVSRLLEQLSFIRDGHFRIVGMALAEPLVPSYYQGVAFEKTQSGYRALESQKVVASVDGWEHLDELFRRSLAGGGRVVYYPVTLGEFNEQEPPVDLTVRYEDGSTDTLSGTIFASAYEESEATVELRENQGIPVLFVRNMGFDEAKGDELGRDFLAYAQELRDEPALILDLRSNGGGNGVLPFKWLEIYTGHPVTTNYVSIKYWSQEDMDAYAANKDNQYYVSEETMTKIAGYAPISDRYTKANAQADAFVESDKLLVILTGKNTGSAAEMLVDIAHNVRNTVIVGGNTYGMLVSNAYTVVALPNSHTPVQFGSDVCLFPEDGDYFEEFVGFKPDFWVQEADAENQAVELVKSLLAQP